MMLAHSIQCCPTGKRTSDLCGDTFYSLCNTVEDSSQSVSQLVACFAIYQNAIGLVGFQVAVFAQDASQSVLAGSEG